MADSPRHPDTGADAGARSYRGPTTGTPRWVKVFGIIALVVVLLVVIVVSAQGSGGGHGPGRHTPSDAGGGATPRASPRTTHRP